VHKFDPKELRSAFSSYMTGVTVVTAVSKSGDPVGFTANSFSSVSLTPPLLLVCPGQHLSSYDVFRDVDHFAVNILAENQEAISNLFASSKGDRFAQTRWAPDMFGSPILDGVAAHFSCETFQCVEAGDHNILIGEVKDFGANSVKGLGFSSSGYFTLTPQASFSERPFDYTKAYAGAVIECGGHVFVQEIDGKFQLPIVEANDPYHASLTIRDHLKNNGLEVDIGQTYSVFDDPNAREHFTYFRASAKSLNETSIGSFVRIEALKTENMNLSTVGIMMNRFKSEYNNKQFGLFIGNTISGDVKFADKP